jgi:hypothetical protein
MIARGRGISGGDLTTIVILSWLGILLGVTWFAALVLSFVWGSGQGAPRDSADVDRLEKLHKLYKSNAITKQEYDAEKKKILGK